MPPAYIHGYIYIYVISFLLFYRAEDVVFENDPTSYFKTKHYICSTFVAQTRQYSTAYGLFIQN